MSLKEKWKLNCWCHKNLINWIEMFGGNFKFYDLRPIYKSFVKKEVQELPEFIELQNYLKAVASFIVFPDIDVFYIKTSQNFTDGRYLFGMYDGICDLKVSGASFARLTVSGFFEYIHPIEFIKNSEGDFELPGVTIETPIFLSGPKIIIESDGNMIYYTLFMFSPSKIRFIYKFGNCHAVSWLPNKNIVMAGHAWIPSLIANEKDFIKIQSFTYKLYFLFCKSLSKYKFNYKIISKLITF